MSLHENDADQPRKPPLRPPATPPTLNAFMTTKFQIDAMLERLTVLSDDHFETHPDELNWGDLGTLNHYASLLRQITDSAFKEV